MTLLDEITQGESKTLELKVKLPLREQIAKTVVAFANTSGGKLIIGVDDDCKLVGLGEDDTLRLQDQVASIVFDRCYPAILPEIYSANLKGKLVLVVEVFRGNLLPYYLKSKGKNGGTYLRVGATNRKADFEHILELERQKRNQSFDEEICREQTLEELDLTPLMKRFDQQGKPLDEQKLKNLKLIALEQGKLWPTQGLMILLGKLPHVVMKCARFRGKDMSVFLDSKEYDGDLFSQLEQAEGFIKNYIRLQSEIRGLQRTDTYELPESALREALVNALVHRDYTNQGRDIKVGVYDDIVNVVSPGGLPSTLTAENLLDGRSEIRNRVVAKVFKALGYIEQWGSGIQRIRAACLAQGLAEPRIREKGDFVDVEFYRESIESAGEKTYGIPKSTGRLSESTGEYRKEYRIVPEGVSDSTGRSIGKVSEQEKRILTYLMTHLNITSSTVEKLAEVKEARARRILREMIGKGLIEKRGNGRNTHYVRAGSYASLSD